MIIKLRLKPINDIDLLAEIIRWLDVHTQDNIPEESKKYRIGFGYVYLHNTDDVFLFKLTYGDLVLSAEVISDMDYDYKNNSFDR
jgi:hypothetical protein